MNTGTKESTIEQTALDWFRGLGYEVVHGPDISPDGNRPARDNYRQVVLSDRLRDAVRRINPELSPDAVNRVVRKVEESESPDLTQDNRGFHRLLTDGVTVECEADDGGVDYETAHLLETNDPDANEWMVVNQFTVQGNRQTRRADIVVFVNGMPLAIFELKNPASENANIHNAYRQLHNYEDSVPDLFRFNELLVIADGYNARLGTLTSPWEWMKRWRSLDGMNVAPPGLLELEVLVKAVFRKPRFIDLVRNFMVFEDNGVQLSKKLALYHQYFAVNKAVGCTLQACGIDGDPEAEGPFPKMDEKNPLKIKDDEATYDPGREDFGDQRIGVIWHTQGSGKSLSMVFYAGKIIRHPAMENPTLVVITDRNDLDDQLFGTFSRCSDLLRQTPVQAESREHLRECLQVAGGGVVFTTIQKFFPMDGEVEHPLLSERSNVVVIADEAHRSQYGFIDGLARHMRDALPNASFVGFTGTPIELEDRNTRSVFGEYIDTYDIQRAVEDEATVPIYYEGRIIGVELEEEIQEYIDEEVEEVLGETELERERQRAKTRWTQMEAVVGAEERLELLASDFVEHFEDRLEVLEGKAMIVGMSRRVCVDLAEQIRRLRPQWFAPDINDGEIKVVMSGSADDPEEWQKYLLSKGEREQAARRFKDPDDPLKVVIVCDMWLTGFDCPCLHTMYVDKPMKGHTLMQAIARVNRVFKDKPAGRVVDYIGMAQPLKKALQNYTNSGGRGQPAVDQEKAVKAMLEAHDIIRGILHGFDYREYLHTQDEKRLRAIGETIDFLSGLENGKERFYSAVRDFSKAFALAVPCEEADEVRDELKFFQEVSTVIKKNTAGDEQAERQEIDTALRQLVSKAIASTEVTDIFGAVGLEKPNISIISDEFLMEVKGMEQKNLAVELLEKLLSDEIKETRKTNVVKARSFSEMLESTIRKYKNRSIEAAQVVEELIEMAKEMRKARERGEDLGLSDEEIAFYDALAENESAVEVLGDDTLRDIANELVEAVHRNTTIDWALRDSTRAQMRILVKNILRKYGYPPDKREAATTTVLKQAEVLCERRVG
ncbi:MAG: type I restriction endonuclease subunit R [Candidatus Brocadiia bacterium]